MKKVLSLIVLTVALIATIFSGCGGTETYNNIAADNNVYSMGTQSVLIEARSLNADEPVAKFKKSISASDIELGQALEGKRVTKVVYNDESSITITLDGNTKVAGGKNVYGTISVKQSGLESKGNSSCTVTVLAPELKVTSYSVSKKTKDGVTVYKITAKLGLPAGAFTDKATAANITLAGGAAGELLVETAENGLIKLTVSNCDQENPTVVLKPEATSFGKEISVKLALGGAVEIK